MPFAMGFPVSPRFSSLGHPDAITGHCRAAYHPRFLCFLYPSEYPFEVSVVLFLIGYPRLIALAGGPSIVFYGHGFGCGVPIWGSGLPFGKLCTVWGGGLYTRTGGLGGVLPTHRGYGVHIIQHTQATKHTIQHEVHTNYQ